MVSSISLALVITGVMLLLLSFRLRERTPAQTQPQLRLLRSAESVPLPPRRSRTASVRTSLRLIEGFKS